MRYCTEMLTPTREIAVNGEVQEPLAPFTLPTTGGWSRVSDNWKIAYAQDPATEAPLLLKFNADKNTLTLTSHDGQGVNIDYLVVASPDQANSD